MSTFVPSSAPLFVPKDPLGPIHVKVLHELEGSERFAKRLMEGDPKLSKYKLARRVDQEHLLDAIDEVVSALDEYGKERSK